jgi:CDP-diglyceride synthetase
MSLNLQTLKTRSLSALVFVIIMLGGLLFHPLAYRLLIALIMAGCGYEFVQISSMITKKKYSSYLMLLLPYIIIPLVMLFDLGAHSPIDTEKFSPLLPCAIIFSIWINDTMAYVVGSVIGKTPFSKYSPKKTWEGAIGGIMLCVLAITLLGANLNIARSLTITQWIIIASCCAIFGTLGDLFESWLKRKAGIKDSGNIMPGHGGFLDRFDSLLFAVPPIWIYIKLIL